MVNFYGTEKEPLRGRHFVRTPLCPYGLRVPEGPYLHKLMVIAATYEEIELVKRVCPKDHDHVQVRGSAPLPGGGTVRLGKLSGAYPLLMGLAWGKAVAKACLRLTADSAESWAERELERIEACQAKAKAALAGQTPRDTVCLFNPATATGSSDEGEEPLFPLADRSVGRTATKTRLESGHTPGDPPAPTPSFTEVSPEQAQLAGSASWANKHEQRDAGSKAAAAEWMSKLDREDFSAPVTPPSCFLPLRDQKEVQQNPRLSEEYKDKCVAACGLSYG